MNSSTSSSSSLKHLTYDVHLSFPGEDTQLRGTPPPCVGSKSFIIVFSKNYAESRWCLDELVKVMEFRTVGQIVFPIFYGVDPSDVRKQTGTFATTFLNHEQRFYEVKENLQLWRSTLTEAANLAGFVVRDG
ncbi:hypothetical protein DVH24_006642 [Malus domestica]|uniref:TIR domain-containing protein n=1 Tax=Malus domestica TaxID=3750 RepID=A0A498KI03_MALDO|nr:hypothetical protein DVH24_006642 [Malus domestica]